MRTPERECSGELRQFNLWDLFVNGIAWSVFDDGIPNGV